MNRDKIDTIERIICLIGMRQIEIKENIRKSISEFGVEFEQGKIRGMEVIKQEIKTWVLKFEPNKETSAKDIIRDIDAFIECYRNLVGKENAKILEPIRKYVQRLAKE